MVLFNIPNPSSLLLIISAILHAFDASVAASPLDSTSRTNWVPSWFCPKIGWDWQSVEKMLSDIRKVVRANVIAYMEYLFFNDIAQILNINA